MDPKSFIYKVGNKIVRHSDWYNNQVWGGASKFWYGSQFGLDIVNLGSGAGVHAFCYEGLPEKGANWALGPQSLVHDFNILKNYFSYIREGGIVIITVCPFSGLFSQYGKSHNFKYYSFLHPATILNFEEEERLKALRLKENPLKEMPIFGVKQTLKEGIRIVKRSLRPMRTADIEVSARRTMEGWKKQFEIHDLAVSPTHQHRQEIRSRRETLMEMIVFCKERSLHPYIIIPVMHESLSSMFPEKFKEMYMDSLTDNSGAPVLDYMNDSMNNSEEYFSTALFLNRSGANIFTRKVINDIKNMEKNRLTQPSGGKILDISTMPVSFRKAA